MALVSIIIPTHNRGELILETLDSIKNQTYKEIEVIIVDDHSTDSSEDIINDYITNSGLNISYYKNIRQGACAARNYGIDLSNGDYIQFFDDDDIMYEDFIKARLDKIMTEDLDFAVCNFHRFDNDSGEILGEVINSNIPDNIVSHIYHSRLPTPCFLFTRNAIRKLGYWNETVNRLQDMAYFHRIYLYGLKGAWMDIFLFKARRHSVTISRKYGNDSMIRALNCIQKEWKGRNRTLDLLLLYKKRAFASKTKKTNSKQWIKFNIHEFANNPTTYISYFIRRIVCKNIDELFRYMI